MQTRTGAYRVIVLVEGTSGSKLTRLDVGAGGEAYLVESPKVRCLLSGEDEECFADLRGNCDFNSILQYRLDKEIALASISSCAAASGIGLPCFTIEHMEKVSRDDKDAVIEALKREVEILWSPAKQPLELGPPRKCRRIDREPTSPSRLLRKY